MVCLFCAHTFHSKKHSFASEAILATSIISKTESHSHSQDHIVIRSSDKRNNANIRKRIDHLFVLRHERHIFLHGRYIFYLGFAMKLHKIIIKNAEQDLCYV